LSDQRRKKPKTTKQNKTAQNKTKKNTTKCPKIICNTVSVSFLACRYSLVVVSSKGERKKKKESGDCSVNGYLGLWLACCACCCQTAIAEGFIYADLRSEVNTHLAQQALFIQSSPGCYSHCYKLSPFQAHWGR
jgi:hypothetical protein